MTDAALNQISQGSLHAIFYDKEKLQREFPVPVLQCVHIKPLGPQGESKSERYRVILSDVRNFVQSMIATQSNHLIHEGRLRRGSIVRLKQYQANAVRGKRILIVLELEVLEELGEPEKFGDPVALNLPPTREEPSNTTISGSGFYGNRPQQPPAQDRAIPSRSGPPSSSAHKSIYPIAGLSMYANKWTIKARVTSKSDIKTWHNASGEGKLFSMNLLDESGEIKATAFKEQCDMLYDQLQEGSVYYISSCKVGFAKKQFTNLPHDYELTFERESEIEKAEDASNVPQVRYNFTNVADLQTIEKDSTIDIIGVIKEISEIAQITSKSTQKPYDKRDLSLVDESGYSVKMTIWGKTAANFNEMLGTVIAFKGAKVSDFGGRSLSLLSSGSMTVNPDISEGHVLRAWYDLDGRTGKFDTHSNMAGVGAAGGRSDNEVTIAQVKENGLGTSENPDYFSLNGTISFVRNENFCYPACKNEGCNKKVTEIDDKWRCVKCEIDHDQPEYRYIMSLNVIDHTAQMWLSCFDDVGRIIMGVSAGELMARKENGTHMKLFENVAYQSFAFRCRAKMDTYQDQQTVRYQVSSVSPINFVSEGNKLAELIKQYSLE